MNRIVYARRPVLNDSFDFRAVNDTVEVPDSLQPFFVQCGVGTFVFELYCLMKSAPSAFSDLGVNNEHLLDAVHDALTVCVDVLPKDLTRVRDTPQFEMGIPLPPDTTYPIGYKVK
jgi:hypothetical protein